MAFSILCQNKNIFQFTQEHGIHGVVIFDTKDPEKKWLNPRLIHSLGYSGQETLCWKSIIASEDISKIKGILCEQFNSRGIQSGEINFRHSKGFLIPMTYKAIKVPSDKGEEEKVVVAVKKKSDYSHLSSDPEFNFLREQLLDTILETIDIGIIACDKRGKLTLFNKAAKKWHGLPAEDIPQTEYASYYNLYHPDGKTLFRAEELGLIDMLQNGIIRNPEMLIKPKGGRERFVIASGARLYDEEKNINGAVIALYDITERKETVDKLRISEETFRESFEHAANGMAIVGLTGKWLKVNDQLCHMLGYSRQELKTKSFKDITHPEDLHSSLNLQKELLKGEREYFQMEKRYIHKNGDVVYIILAVSLIRDVDSKPLQFVSQITDITPLKHAQKKLRHTLDQFQNLLEASTRVSIIALDQQGMILTFNKGAENLLGYSRDEMIGQKNILDLHFKDEIQMRANELSEAHGRKVKPEKVLQVIADRENPDTREWKYRCKNGEALPVQLTATPVYDGDFLTGYLCVATDITELKRAQNELRSILEISEEQNDRLRNFAHIVSHNLRSHSGNLQMLLEIYTEENPEVKEDEVIKMSCTASENLKETIEHLNEVALINTSVSKKLPSLNLKDSVGKSLTSINALLQKSNVEIINNIPEEYEVLALPAYFESSILNFTTNAVKYRSPKRKPVLKFNAVKKNEYIELEIEDNGLGIDLERDGPKLFGMYKTFHGNEDARGIGLFITKNQIEAIGGKIEVESEVGRGTVFTISFKYEKI